MLYERHLGSDGPSPGGSFSKNNRSSSTPGSSRTGHENILGVMTCIHKKGAYHGGWPRVWTLSRTLAEK